MSQVLLTSLRRSLGKSPDRREWGALMGWLVVLLAGAVWAWLDTTGQVKIVAVSTVVLLLSSLSLTVRTATIMLVAVVSSVVVVITDQGWTSRSISASGATVIAVAGGATWLQARRRDRLGLRQVSAETVLGLIRDRLDVQAQVPAVPEAWSIQVANRPADGAAISGDFVASRVIGEPGAQVLHLAIVDVSGSGFAAGPPALLLSGAIGGLLGTVEPDEFLGAANEYLGRQHWPIGFASASYVRLEFSTGDYQIRTAGHPPAVHYQGSDERGSSDQGSDERGSDEGLPRWRDSGASGTVLGVTPILAGISDGATLRSGDVLVVYTDGVVEDRTHDLDNGIERLKRHVERLAASHTWDTAADDLVDAVPRYRGDDRTVVVIRRVAESDSADRPGSDGQPRIDNRQLTVGYQTCD